MKYSILIFVLFLFLSCSPLLHNLNKFQSDKQFKKTENLNFAGEKAKTQWWYLDCVLEDGSVLIFLFTPHQWWNENEKITSDKSLLYISYMYPDGKVKSVKKVLDNKDFSYDENSLNTPFFQLVKAHGKNSRSYSIRFTLDEFEGSAAIHSTSKGFSPFPTGSMGKFATRNILKLKGKDLAFRYASHVPQGKVECNLEIEGKAVSSTGKGYHEQGWFNGSSEKMGKGWNWFHFVSDRVNVFGKPGDFICFEKDGDRIQGGIFFKEYSLSNPVYSDSLQRFLVGANVKFSSGKKSFEIGSKGQLPSVLINIPSFDSDQLWGTVVQPSVIILKNKGKEITEAGILILETCNMSKESASQTPVPKVN